MSSVGIGERRVGRGEPAYLIAEIGANHNGSLETAREMVRLCAAAGADAVKFQAYDRAGLYNPTLPAGGGAAGERNRELLRRRWEVLPRFSVPGAWWPELAGLCDELGVDFLCSAFDLDRLGEIDRVGVKAHKVASGDLTWSEYLRAVGRLRKPVLLATGASTLAEVERAVESLRAGGAREVVLLHCVSNYPPKWEDGNLRALETLASRFGVPVGLSDHSPGSTLPVAAIALGACVVEKHVTLDRTQEGLDHHFALEMDELARLVEDVRHAEQALGTGEKRWAPDEEIERYWVRRGLWVAAPVAAGEPIRRDRLRVVRPCHGMAADRLDEVVGRRARRALEAGAPLEEGDVE